MDHWLLLLSVLTLVFTFESSSALALAFGMAVTGTITITTLLFFYIVRHQWHTPLWLVAIGAGFLLTVDLLFLAANATKIAHGTHARTVGQNRPHVVARVRANAVSRARYPTQRGSGGARSPASSATSESTDGTSRDARFGRFQQLGRPRA